MKYHLAEACQNTFVLFDCLDSSAVDDAFLHMVHHCLAEEGRDDALILMDGKAQDDAFYARMIVLGLDGTLGEFCGNGARACAAYLFEHYPMVRNFFLVTPHGVHPLAKHGERTYSIKLPPARFQLNEKFIASREHFNAECGLHYVEMIEPHLIVERKMSDEDLFSLGRKLNQKKDLFPLGINVNAWHTLNDETLYVKTYERGVQRLTQSCGTGSMSCASFYKKLGKVHVSTPGGHLEIQLGQDGIELKGAAFSV